MRVDKITMATSVEARVPFLDHHLVEYALALPIDLKIKGASGKYILKRALETVFAGGIAVPAQGVALARPFASGFAAGAAGRR